MKLLLAFAAGWFARIALRGRINREGHLSYEVWGDPPFVAEMVSHIETFEPRRFQDGWTERERGDVRW